MCLSFVAAFVNVPEDSQFAGVVNKKKNKIGRKFTRNFMALSRHILRVEAAGTRQQETTKILHTPHTFFFRPQIINRLIR